MDTSWKSNTGYQQTDAVAHDTTETEMKRPIANCVTLLICLCGIQYLLGYANNVTLSQSHCLTNINKINHYYQPPDCAFWTPAVYGRRPRSCMNLKCDNSKKSTFPLTICFLALGHIWPSCVTIGLLEQQYHDVIRRINSTYNISTVRGGRNTLADLCVWATTSRGTASGKK